MTQRVMGEMTQKWVSLILSLLVPAALGIGTMLYNSQQDQIDRLQDQVWEQQRVNVTEDKLNREIERVIQIVDLKLSSIETQQREISNQLAIALEQNREFQREVRDRFQEQE